MKHTVWGKVQKGAGRGKSFGFPTANIALHKDIPEGVYVSRTKITGIWYDSVTFVGAAKTFGATKKYVETTIFDFHRNLYQQWITVQLLHKLRANRRFDTPDALMTQMKTDEQQARTFHSQFSLS